MYQSGVGLHEGTPACMNATNVLLHSTVAVTFVPTVVQGDPLPEARGRLLAPAATLPAVYFAPAAPARRDMLGNARGANLPATDRFGPRDLGAIERIGDTIFGDGFGD